MSPFAKGTLIDAALGSILITVLLLPGQAFLPQYAPPTRHSPSSRSCCSSRCVSRWAGWSRSS